MDTNDRWVPVVQPAATVIQPNEAYWVFCLGASEYQGPLDVVVPRGVRGRLDFGDMAWSVSLKLANNLANRLAVTLELSPVGALPLTYGKRLLNAGQSAELPLAGRQPWEHSKRASPCRCSSLWTALPCPAPRLPLC